MRERGEMSAVTPRPGNLLRTCEGQVQWGVQVGQRERHRGPGSHS